ncbi:xanthine dehydrogenase family protein molybdopterin-binding subunit [Streptomyces sp. Isolate_45]|uniref:xanthine dehydrogenase family protein molybdopterin-binding subunit n=1 Tax=Streptomyces sp. Isolate_45 TaxID=2950111 RepID=UPI002481F023|nr:xanthine dehydrogenase family protein molybdopterin-binding subunit [Streptomyces sp. Isolate_45]MDA5279407.1 xanthine dehydrogenase family protein molybdopterin-binding subunit [Streptomyces sp. Isolate_45]
MTRASIGASPPRREAREKVTGSARYTGDVALPHLAHVAVVPAEIVHGRVKAVHPEDALARPGVLAVLHAANCPRLNGTGWADLAVLQSRSVVHRGQFVAAVVAESPRIAHEAARTVRVDYAPGPHRLSPDTPGDGFHRPPDHGPFFPTDCSHGDVESALSHAPVRIEATYTTPPYHHHALEPHGTVAYWHDGALTVFDTTQGPSGTRDILARLFEISPDQVRVIAAHVGGGFGSKAAPRAHLVLAAVAALAVGRPVKTALTREQLSVVAGYRPPTVQRVRLGAEADGRLLAVSHVSFEQTSLTSDHCEYPAAPTRTMYAAPNRETRHWRTRLNVPSPTWMRAPGECPGMFALESAMDELAVACSVDPIELRLRNDTANDPHSGRPFSTRNLAACLRLGAERFGWADRDRLRAERGDGRRLVGMGVAASTIPQYRFPSRASARTDGLGHYAVRIAAVDIGTGARTVLAQIAADTLRVDVERVTVEVGDSAYPAASWAGRSSGTTSWGTAVVRACEGLRGAIGRCGGRVPDGGLEAVADTLDELATPRTHSQHAFGAQFAEVTVDTSTGEVRVPRMLGVFAVGRVINPVTVRSQLVGGMVMGLSMALCEVGVIDRTYGHFHTRDLAAYHVATFADAPWIEAVCIDEEDFHTSPMGSKGVGEIGIVGTAAAIANAVHHATGHRIRGLPIDVRALTDAGARGSGT